MYEYVFLSAVGVERPKNTSRGLSLHLKLPEGIPPIPNIQSFKQYFTCRLYFLTVYSPIVHTINYVQSEISSAYIVLVPLFRKDFSFSCLK